MKNTQPMRTLGLIGGMGYEFNAIYYSGLNQAVAKEMGGLHSAAVLMASVDSHRIVD